MLFVTLFLVGFHCSDAQESKVVIPDSLQGLPYKTLFTAYQKVKRDTVLSKLYLSSILHNSKQTSDSLHMAVAYCYLSSYENNEVIKLAMLDSSIAVSPVVNGHKKYPIKPYSFKGGYYLKKGEYQKALDAYFMTLNLSEKLGNEEYLQFANHNIGVVKTKIGRHEEALPLFKQSFEYAKEKYASHSMPYIKALLPLAKSYTYNKNTDIAASLNDEAMQIIGSDEDLRDTFYGRVLLHRGINLYYKKEYDQAYSQILEGTRLLNPNDIVNLDNFIVSAYYLGKIHTFNGDLICAEREFKRMDLIIQKEQIAFVEVRQGYEFLIGLYKAKGDKESQLEFVNKLLWFDKRVNNTNTTSRLFKEFDTPILLKEKEALIADLKGETRNLKRIVWFLGALILMISVFFYMQYRAKLRYKDKFNKILKSKEKSGNSKTTCQSDIGIGQEVVEDILQKLSLFEAKKQFLQKNINIALLSREMNTNTKYLSKIINYHKNKSFINYVNDLRVEYSIEQLKESDVLKSYTIQGIAEEVGFNSAESYSSAFKKSTGIKPSYFLRELTLLNDK